MLRSILLSADPATARVIARAFRDLEVGFEQTSDAGVVLSNGAKHRYDAVLIDDSIEDAGSVLEKVIANPACAKTVRIVLANPVTAANVVFTAGAQVILYKPLSVDRVRHGLRAVRNLMGRDRRRGSKRVSTMLPAKIRNGWASGSKVFITDLSDSGAALHYPDGRIQPAGSVQMEFAIPSDPERISVTAELIWQNNQGAAGIHFLDMSTGARKKLAQWVKEQATEADNGGAAAATHAGA